MWVQASGIHITGRDGKADLSDNELLFLTTATLAYSRVLRLSFVLLNPALYTRSACVITSLHNSDSI